MKQTAVEWLNEQMNNIKGSSISMNGSVQFIEKELNNLFEQAKAMEKEQIMDAREDGHLSTYAEYGSNPKCYLDGGHEQYYNETFKSE